jgi:hypothetical protein
MIDSVLGLVSRTRAAFCVTHRVRNCADSLTAAPLPSVSLIIKKSTTAWRSILTVRSFRAWSRLFLFVEYSLYWNFWSKAQRRKF